MSEAELRAACAKFPDGYIQVVLPRSMPSRTNRVRLAGRNGPLGTAIGEVGHRRTLADFKSAEVIAWLDSLPKEEPSNG